MLVWNLNGQGGNSLQGSVFAAVGTSITSSAGLAISYAGLGVQNPSTSGKKITPLQISFTPTGTGASNNGCPFGLIKILGTAAAGTLSGFGGFVATVGVAGTATNAVGTAFGTCTILNGTAGPSANGLCWMQIVGEISGGGTGAGTQAFTPTAGAQTGFDLQGLVSAMPGESIAIGVNQATAGIFGMIWLETPLTSGA
jgi:hypothetical protein